MRLFMGVLALTTLPLAAVAGEGRYQGVGTGANRIFVVDTKTGEVIKWCSPDRCLAVKDDVKNQKRIGRAVNCQSIGRRQINSGGYCCQKRF